MTFRRVIGTVAAATMLALVPTAAAFAYNGDEAEFVQVTETNPEPGEPVEVLVEGGPDASEVTLEVTSQQSGISDDSIDIEGTQSMSKQAVAGGAQAFTVTLHAEGRYNLTGTNDNGEVVGEATLVVGDGSPGDAGDDAGEGDDDSSTGGVGGLGDTGAGAGTAILGGAGALLVLAGGALLLARRRKASLA